VGGTLIGFLIGLYVLDPLFNLNRTFAQTSQSGKGALEELEQSVFSVLVLSKQVR